MIYYCFFSHFPKINEDTVRIKEMMANLKYPYYFIFYGGENKNFADKNTIHLNCEDGYCDLPKKVNYAFKYLINNNISFDHIVKFDRTIIVKKIFDQDFLDYSGWVHSSHDATGGYHFNRCENTHKWYNKWHHHALIPYCWGIGYVLSFKSVKILSEDYSYEDFPIEDLYVGSVLRKNNVLPSKFPFKSIDYFFDPDHKSAFYYHDNFLFYSILDTW